MSDHFESDRLAMRPQRVDDADALFEAYRDPELMRYWSGPPHADVAESRADLASRIGNPDWRGWSMTLKGSDRAIGTLSASLRRPGVSEIGYLLVRRHWGLGYASEGVAWLLDLLFRQEGHRRVFADADPDNASSVRLLEALGFRREGLLRAEWETDIGVRDSLILGLLADEWREVGA